MEVLWMLTSKFQNGSENRLWYILTTGQRPYEVKTIYIINDFLVSDHMQPHFILICSVGILVWDFISKKERDKIYRVWRLNAVHKVRTYFLGWLLPLPELRWWLDEAHWLGLLLLFYTVWCNCIYVVHWLKEAFSKIGGINVYYTADITSQKILG